MSKHTQVPTTYLFLLLAAILLDEIFDNYLLGTFHSRSMPQKAILYGLFLLIQIIAAPLQAGISDFYCRKKSLIISLCCSVVSAIFMFFYFFGFFSQIFVLFIAALVKSTMGNTLPLAWAGIADTQNQNYRFSLGLSTVVMALGYLSLLIIEGLCGEKRSVFIIALLFICLIPAVYKKFVDLVDRKNHRARVADELGLDRSLTEGKVKYGFSLLFLDAKSLWSGFLRRFRLRLGLLGVFLPLETSFYSTHSLGIDLAIRKFEIVTILMIIGYITGVFTLRYHKDKDDELLIKIGYNISIFSFLIMFALMFLLESHQLRWVIAMCYFIYSFGVAFIVPSLFSTLSKEREPHEQGKMYGLIGSVDSAALLLALIADLVYSFHQKHYYMIYFSFIMFLTSWWFYSKFSKEKKEFS